MQLIELTARCKGPIADCAIWQVAKVIRFIEENLETRIQVNDPCDLVHLSPSRFSSCFRSSVGQSPYHYILWRRIDRAKQMLATTDAPLCQVALASGRCDQSHLSNMFKRMVGVTPLAWRRLRLSGEIAKARTVSRLHLRRSLRWSNAS